MAGFAVNRMVTGLVVAHKQGERSQKLEGHIGFQRSGASSQLTVESAAPICTGQLSAEQAEFSCVAPCLLTVIHQQRRNGLHFSRPEISEEEFE